MSGVTSERGDEAILLRVQDLHTHFFTDQGTVRATEGVSFELRRGEILGVLGESGCGKSVTNLSIMGLLPRGQGRVVQGEIAFLGQSLATLSEEGRRKLRGRHMAMVFQDPMSSLNPYLRIGEQLIEAPVLHLGQTPKQARERAVALLTRVGIAEAAARMQAYPHELSGGMRQRVMLAMALLCDPELLILDEPTTALDVTVQAQILDLIRELSEERQLSAIFVTHDLGVAAGLCDRVLVMYAGRVVEQGPAARVFGSPGHPYTRALLRSRPASLFERSGAQAAPASGGAPAMRTRLQTIEGNPPRLDGPQFTACSFAPRCTEVHAACLTGEPELRPWPNARAVRCVLPAPPAEEAVQGAGQ
jgi:peptide/nickel transport system ATP-binding protein